MNDDKVITISVDSDSPDSEEVAEEPKSLKAMRAFDEKHKGGFMFPSFSGDSISSDIHPRNEKAEYFCELIAKDIKDYESSLSENQTVVMRLGSFSQNVEFRVAEIDHHGPNIMKFRGTVDGQPATLIQHVSQINYLLTSAEKDPNQAWKPIKVRGFGGTATVAGED